MLAELAAAAMIAMAPAGFTRAPSLEPAASWAAGKPVSVFCGPSAEWSGYTPVAGGNEIWLAQRGCAMLGRRLVEREANSDELAWYLLTVAHEAQHVRGTTDESQADCDGLRLLPSLASRFFGFKTWRARHDLMAFAWAGHRRQPAVFTRLCP